VLNEEQIFSHSVAQVAIDRILPRDGKRWAGVCGRRAAGRALFSEYDVVQWLSEAMRREKLVWENGPNVSTNAHTSDSHYEASAGRSATIHEGDFVLIDIWGRVDRPEGVSTTSPGPE